MTRSIPSNSFRQAFPISGDQSVPGISRTESAITPKKHIVLDQIGWCHGVRLVDERG
jgi:hypothetical protein